MQSVLLIRLGSGAAAISEHIWAKKSPSHGRPHGSHDFGCANTKGGETQNAVTLGLNQSLQKSSRFRKRAGAHYRFQRNLEPATSDTLLFCCLLTRANASKFRMRKQAKPNSSSCRHAFAAGDAGVDHAKVVRADVSKMRTTCYLADCSSSRLGSTRFVAARDVASLITSSRHFFRVYRRWDAKEAKVTRRQDIQCKSLSRLKFVTKRALDISNRF